MYIRKTIYLYDPLTNIQTPTTYEELYQLTGINKKTLTANKSYGYPIKSIGCYITGEKIPLKNKRKWHELVQLEGEIWKVIKNSEYLVSNYGRVKIDNKFLLPQNKRGVLSVRIIRNNKVEQAYISRLVYETFIGELKPGKYIIHKNKIATDNHFLNLAEMDRKKYYSSFNRKKACMPVVKINRMTGKILEEYDSVTQAAKQNFMDRNTMQIRVNGHKKFDDEFIFQKI